MRFFEIVDRVLDYYPEADIALLEKAYVFAARVNKGRSRLEGEPYLEHSLAVAGTLAEIRMDVVSIAAGLIHNTLDEQLGTEEEIGEAFGPDVLLIASGVSKLNRLGFGPNREKQAEYVRKMVLAMSRDVRVLLVKLADRIQDMRHADRFPEGTRIPMARETRDIYAPLAARLGIDRIKQELEDLAFRVLEPEGYEDLVRSLAGTAEERNRYIEEVKKTLSARLLELGIGGQVSGRPKHLYSIYRKMERRNLDLNCVHDLIAFRIIVPSMKDCYETLGLVHSMWEPEAGRFKDYIVKPKANGYRSLHTTVRGPYGERMEVQIRTEEMNRIARDGIAAHWLYKEKGGPDKVEEQDSRRFSWLRELIELRDIWKNPRAVLEAVGTVDLYPDEVYVFTPQGDVKAFPVGATPVDFAYDVHSEVGHRCVGARVNGKMVPLRTELRNGDTVEVITSANQRPSKDWLKFAKTGKAQSRIKHYFKAEERERSVAQGREFCEREFRKKGLNFNNYFSSPELLEVARGFSVRTVADLLAAVGGRKISPLQIVGRLPSLAREEEEEKERREETIPMDRRKPELSPGDGGVTVRGADDLDDLMVNTARCCNPVPGDPIVGYITRGRGITVHRKSCKNVGSDLERIIEVEWNTGADNAWPVSVRVVYSGGRGILAALSGALGQLDARLLGLQMESGENEAEVCRLRIEVRDTRHLQRVLIALRSEKGVFSVQRLTD